MDTKLTVRVPRHLLENAKRYARENHTTLTEMISTYLQNLSGEEESQAITPRVRYLTGLLSGKVTTDDYKKHLEEKYGGK